MKVVITGGSGRAGQNIIPELIARGHEVTNADAVEGPHQGARFMRVDATDLGAVIAITRSAEAIIHMAAIPSPTKDPEGEVFRVNMMSNWNVLEAAEIHGITKLVMASSINAVGAGFSPAELDLPAYLPIDEELPTRAQDGYALSKWLGEGMADAFCRRRDMQIASMRFHALMDEETQRVQQAMPNDDPHGNRSRGFWGWTDRQDAAIACRLAIEKDWTGHEPFFINGDETTLNIGTQEAVDVVYPGVPIRKPLTGFTSAIDNSKAKALLGWEHKTQWVR